MKSIALQKTVIVSHFSEMVLRHPDVVKLRVLKQKYAASRGPADSLRRRIEDIEQKIVLDFAQALDEIVNSNLTEHIGKAMNS